MSPEILRALWQDLQRGHRDRWKDPCGPWDARRARSATLHIMSAWCCEKGLELAWIGADARSGEPAAVLKLLVLSPKGGIVTTDALNCQREIVDRIVAKGEITPGAPDHRALHAEISQLLKPPATDWHLTIDNNHGRLETRAGFVRRAIEELQLDQRWPGLVAVGR